MVYPKPDSTQRMGDKVYWQADKARRLNFSILRLVEIIPPMADKIYRQTDMSARQENMAQRQDSAKAALTSA